MLESDPDGRHGAYPMLRRAAVDRPACQAGPSPDPPFRQPSPNTVSALTPDRIVIATRELLPLWQAEHVKARLKPSIRPVPVELLGMTTRGDQILDWPLSKVGGEGLFVKNWGRSSTVPPTSPCIPRRRAR